MIIKLQTNAGDIYYLKSLSLVTGSFSLTRNVQEAAQYPNEDSAIIYRNMTFNRALAGDIPDISTVSIE